MSLERLVEQFRARTLPAEAWTHAAHLRVGAWHVHTFGTAAALELLRERIRRLNELHGTPNSDTSGYHETITIAYLQLIDEFLVHLGGDVTLDASVDLLLDSPLALPGVLATFWTPGVLFSRRARAEWVAPDRAQLALHTVPDCARFLSAVCGR